MMLNTITAGFDFGHLVAAVAVAAVAYHLLRNGGLDALPIEVGEQDTEESQQSQTRQRMEAM